MSRCFPYLPPGYVRNPVAVPPVPVVETTAKLQRERERAERKKEKRNDKKAYHQVGGGETSKHSKRSHKKRKHEDTNIACQESKTASKVSVEQLEKSGLSEDHGAPCIQTVHGSPESSLDSSKRRKIVLSGPSQNKNGTVVRIKIKRDPDSPSALLDGSRVLQQPPVRQTVTSSSLLSKQNAVQPRREVMVKSPATLQQSIWMDTQAVPKQMDVKPPATNLQRAELPSMTNIARKMDPPASAKIMQKMDLRVSVNAAMVKGGADPMPTQLTRRVVPPPAKAAQRIDFPPAKVIDITTAKVLKKANPPVPSKVLRSDAPPPSVQVLQNEATCAVAICQPDGKQPPVLHKSKVPVETPLVKQQQASSFAKEEPCSSGRNTEKDAVPKVERSKSDRKKSRKVEKKERKFGDLFVTWKPHSLEMEDTGDVGDQDWLLGAKKPDASMSSGKASDGSAQIQPMELDFSWQPRAVYLPDLHVYQLPYVVPF